MEIKTKFDVGDDVYFIDDSEYDANGHIIQKIVKGKIQRRYDTPEWLPIHYEVDCGTFFCMIGNDMLFPTYNEVKEYIKKKRSVMFKLLKLINNGKSTK